MLLNIVGLDEVTKGLSAVAEERVTTATSTIEKQGQTCKRYQPPKQQRVEEGAGDLAAKGRKIVRSMQ